MRSRYSAFVTGDVTYLLLSWHSSSRPASLDLEPVRKWTGLEIIGKTGGNLFDANGTVEFIARYDGGEQYENSEFTREDGRWRYVRSVSS
jgi:SEC-C motif-containing protein